MSNVVADRVEPKAEKILLDYLKRASQVRIMKLRIYKLYESVDFITDRFRKLMTSMNLRVECLKGQFEREFHTMRDFYMTKSKKNKKFKPFVDLFNQDIDREVMDLLLREYAQNVAVRYCTLKLFIWK